MNDSVGVFFCFFFTPIAVWLLCSWINLKKQNKKKRAHTLTHTNKQKKQHCRQCGKIKVVITAKAKDEKLKGATTSQFKKKIYSAKKSFDASADPIKSHRGESYTLWFSRAQTEGFPRSCSHVQMSLHYCLWDTTIFKKSEWCRNIIDYCYETSKTWVFFMCPTKHCRFKPHGMFPVTMGVSLRQSNREKKHHMINAYSVWLRLKESEKHEPDTGDVSHQNLRGGNSGSLVSLSPRLSQKYWWQNK